MLKKGEETIRHMSVPNRQHSRCFGIREGDLMGCLGVVGLQLMGQGRG